MSQSPVSMPGASHQAGSTLAIQDAEPGACWACSAWNQWGSPPGLKRTARSGMSMAWPPGEVRVRVKAKRNGVGAVDDEGPPGVGVGGRDGDDEAAARLPAHRRP